jgi:arylformamidase
MGNTVILTCAFTDTSLVRDHKEEGYMEVKEVVDLSQELYDGMPNITNHPVMFGSLLSFEFSRSLSEGKVEASAKQIVMPEHCGTHLDAPLHFDPSGTSAEKLPLSRLVLPGHLLDFRHKGQPGDLLTVADFEEAEEKTGRRVGPGTAVIAWTGCDDDFGRPNFMMERPGVPVESARWLVERGVTLFCTDLIGIDDPEAWEWPSHDTWLKNDVPMVQQLRNLEQLEGKEFLFIALPLKMRESTGSPVRAVALVTA